MTRILIIEDDSKLNLLMKEFLQRYHYEVLQIRNFKEAEKEIAQAKPDLILLDINLPYLDGFYLCRMIRKKSSVPIIIVSARNSDMEQIMGLELGADDYLVKPFHMELLMTKIKAALRRAYGEYANPNPNLAGADGLVLNPNNFRMSYGGRELELSKNEFKLMKKLLENNHKIVTREDLLMELWDDQTFVEDNTLTVNITRLKDKLEELGIVRAVKTIRGTGYLLEWGAKEELHGPENLG
jgi:DNA-binding response OmpR family regulator